LFILHTAPDASYARSIAELSKFDINEAMRDLKARLYERSCFGCRELTSIFQAMDKAGSHRLDVDDFRWGLMDYGVQISKEDAHELQAHFDNEGQVNWRAFLDSLVGTQNWNEAREAGVRSTYQSLDEGGNGAVTLDQIAQRLDPTQLP
jgi:Ca2+-binding EF-hand superfamily protein